MQYSRCACKSTLEPMSTAEVMLKTSLFIELLVTVLLLATIGCFFEVHNPYMCGQIAWVSKYCRAVFIMAL